MCLTFFHNNCKISYCNLKTGDVILKRIKIILTAILMLMMCMSFTGCGDGSDSDSAEKGMQTGSFVIQLFSEYAPKTVENFKSLVKSGFYDGLTFHRVMDGFMAQGGDPEGTGFGGSDKTIVGEFAQNGFTQNTLSHTRGVVSMARGEDMNSASSQFFICFVDSTFLDGQYAAFGKVNEEGMKVVDKFLTVERTDSGKEKNVRPVTPITIKSAKMINETSDGHEQVEMTVEYKPA